MSRFVDRSGKEYLVFIFRVISNSVVNDFMIKTLLTQEKNVIKKRYRCVN